MAPSKGNPNKGRGYIIPIGGAEEKSPVSHILRRFIEFCGGENAKIAIVPTASMVDETVKPYPSLFELLGVEKISLLNIESREDCNRDDNLSELERSTGIFITGGNQVRLSTIIGGTPIAKAIRKLNADGVHVAGTSAGAAIMAEHMISGGESGGTPTMGGVTISPGLGLTNSVIIDQHFSQRDRYGRLFSALSFNPFLTGLGIDEDTAAFINPEGEFEVVGSGVVTVVDASELKESTIASVKNGAAVTLIGLKLHVLAAGSRFNLISKEAFPKE
tara:strand:- start:6231 stop:7055 length:825 start_codon:yes stop_codon:yes gene_type:complete